MRAIGERTKRRIKEFGTEKDFFRKIWKERPHICYICGCFIYEAGSYCFSHNLSKQRYPEYRYEPKNITLLCSIECHRENDRLNKGKDLYFIHLFSEKSEK